MTSASAGSSTGRPREFDVKAALQAALMAFWRGGYAATSLEDLTAAMGLSRSSFYGAFGSKHDVLLAAVRYYADGVYADLQVLAAARRTPVDSIQAIVRAIAKPCEDENGCVLVNSVAELAPDDVEVCKIARMQVGRVTCLLQELLARAGHEPGTAAHLSGALIACAFGATTLRKAGLPEATLAGLLEQVDRLLHLPSGKANTTAVPCATVIVSEPVQLEHGATAAPTDRPHG